MHPMCERRVVIYSTLHRVCHRNGRGRSRMLEGTERDRLLCKDKALTRTAAKISLNIPKDLKARATIESLDVWQGNLKLNLLADSVVIVRRIREGVEFARCRVAHLVPKNATAARPFSCALIWSVLRPENDVWYATPFAEPSTMSADCLQTREHMSSLLR